MLIGLWYGEKEIKVDIPNKNVLAILEPKCPFPKIDVKKELRNRLMKPLNSQALREVASSDGEVLILIDDYTRRTPTKEILPCIIDELKNGGVPKNRIKILMALGTHREPTDNEIIDKVGKEIYDEYSVTYHDWSNPKVLVNLGKIENKVPIRINKLLSNADLVLGIGMILPHRVTGFSGGGKIVQPGVSGPEITGYTHWKSAEYPGEEILGKLYNPIKEIVDKVADLAGLKFLINLVLDESNNVVGIFAGEPHKVHEEGAKMVKKVYGVKAPKRADIVIADCPSPTDIDMWQAAKSLYAANLIVKPRGTIIFLARCPEGISPEHPEVEEIGYKPFREVKELVKKGIIRDLVAAGHIVHVGEVIKEKAHCILISDYISEETASHVGFEYASSVEEALEIAFKRHGADAEVIVMKRAPELLPLL